MNYSEDLAIYMIYCRIIKAMSVRERLLIEQDIKSTNPQSWEYLLFVVTIYRATALYHTYTYYTSNISQKR